MTFAEVELDARDREELTLRRWDSAGGRWRIQLGAVLFGVRCYLGRVDELRCEIAGGWEVVYCCGLQPVALMLVPAVMIKSLDGVAEDAPLADIRGIFPAQHVKPMYNDPECWRRLCELAGVPELAGILEINPKEPTCRTR